MLSYTILKQSFSGERSRARGLSCSNYAHGVKKWPAPGVTYFTYEGLYRKNIKKFFCPKPQGLEA